MKNELLLKNYAFGLMSWATQESVRRSPWIYLYICEFVQCIRPEAALIICNDTDDKKN